MRCHQIYFRKNFYCVFGFHLNFKNIQNKLMKCMYIKICGNKASKTMRISMKDFI